MMTAAAVSGSGDGCGSGKGGGTGNGGFDGGGGCSGKGGQVMTAAVETAALAATLVGSSGSGGSVAEVGGSSGCE